MYDLAKFGGEIVVDIMRTNPMIIIGGALQENPFFVPPDEFLRELRERNAAQNERTHRRSDDAIGDGTNSR
jgi:hypothetical protein